MVAKTRSCSCHPISRAKPDPYCPYESAHKRRSRTQLTGKLISLLLVSLPGSPFAAARPWKNDAGQIIEADLVTVRGESAILSRTGKEFVFPINKLSPEDRGFLKEWQAHPPAATSMKLSFAGQPLETGGKVNVFEFDYSPALLKELKARYKSDETKFKITIVTPANFVALETDIEKLDKEWTNFRKWSFATGGFSGGGKGCYYIAA